MNGPSASPVEYSLSPSDAIELASIVALGLAERRLALADYQSRHGPAQLVELFAQFIGMANSVAANCAEMSDIVLISECGVHPDRFESVNLPTIAGACHGVLLAARCNPAGACYGCAYRLGSIANQSPIATADAEFKAFDPKGFLCHAHTDDDGEPRKVCIGHAKANKRIHEVDHA